MKILLDEMTSESGVTVSKDSYEHIPYQPSIILEKVSPIIDDCTLFSFPNVL